MNQNHTGLKCPSCDFTIKFTIDMLLHDQGVSCPGCGLKMSMKVPVDMKQHLQEISLAEKMIEKTKNFSG